MDTSGDHSVRVCVSCSRSCRLSSISLAKLAGAVGNSSDDVIIPGCSYDSLDSYYYYEP